MRLRVLGRSLLTASSCLHKALQSAAEAAPGSTAMMPQPGSLRCNSHFHASTSGRASTECRAGTPAQQQRALHGAADANARRPQRDTQRRQQALQDAPAAMQVHRRGHTIAAAPALAERASADAQAQPVSSQESWQRPERRATLKVFGRGQGVSGSLRRQSERLDNATAAPRQPQQQRSGKRPRPDGDQPAAAAAAAGAQAGAGVQAGLLGPSAASSLHSAGAPAVLRGVVHRVTYKSADTGYTVLKVKPRSVQGFDAHASARGPRGGGSLIVVGQFPEVTEGQEMRFTGEWVRHSKFGQQLRATQWEHIKPDSDEGLIAYLSGGAAKGVGPVTAAAMVAEHGNAILDIMDGPEAVEMLQRCKGIGPKTAVKIKTDWDKRSGDRVARDFLMSCNVSSQVVRQLLAAHGADAEAVVKRDPYMALMKTGSHNSFRWAEKLAVKLGTPLNLPSRLGSAMVQVLSTAVGSGGHTYLPWRVVTQEAERLLQSTGRPYACEQSMEDVALDMFLKGLLVVEGGTAEPRDAAPAQLQWDDAARCYLPDMYNAEVRVSQRLAELARRPPVPVKISGPQVTEGPALERHLQGLIQQLSSTDGQVLSQGQRAAVLQAATAPVLVLTGGPGCGKTTTTKHIVSMWHKLGKAVNLCAPTGRASQRLQEASQHPSETIHRMLGWKTKGAHNEKDDDSSSSSRYRFNHTADDPLTCDAVLVDEASMLDLPLGSALLDALPAHCQLVLVGDVDQLPPVGPGTVLADAIRSGVVPVIDLREIFRQAQQSAIVGAAHAILSGSLPSLLQRLQHVKPSSIQEHLAPEAAQALVQSDALFVEVARGDQVEGAVQDALFNLIAPLGRFDIAKEVQVITPMRKVAAGTNHLNTVLQSRLNSLSPTAGASQKSALPILSSVAGTSGATAGSGASSQEDASPDFMIGDKVIQTFNNYDKEVFNGDVGFVVAVNPRESRLTVQFPALEPGQVTDVPYFGATELAELQLAWATTVHKAQGAEFKGVVLVLAPQHRVLLNRRLLYTALTRAKQLVVVVGTQGALATAVAAMRSHDRLSTLHTRIAALATARGASRLEPQSFGSQPFAQDGEAPALESQLAAEGLAETAADEAAEAVNVAAQHLNGAGHVNGAGHCDEAGQLNGASSRDQQSTEQVSSAGQQGRSERQHMRRKAPTQRGTSSRRIHEGFNQQEFESAFMFNAAKSRARG